MSPELMIVFAGIMLVLATGLLVWGHFINRDTDKMLEEVKRLADEPIHTRYVERVTREAWISGYDAGLSDGMNK